MKKCPFCAEQIQDEAIKCKHCGEFLDGHSRPPPILPERLPWYYRTSGIIFAVACVGPLALPLVWFRPGLSIVWKVVLTILILALTWILVAATIKSFEILKEYYKLMEGF